MGTGRARIDNGRQRSTKEPISGNFGRSCSNPPPSPSIHTISSSVDDVRTGSRSSPHDYIILSSAATVDGSHQLCNKIAHNLGCNPEFAVSQRSSLIEHRFGLIE